MFFNGMYILAYRILKSVLFICLSEKFGIYHIRVQIMDKRYKVENYYLKILAMHYVLFARYSPL